MRIRLDGTYAELAHAINKIRTILPVGSVSQILPLHERPHTWRVFLDTAPKRTGGRWIT
ncbi:hypothetical protein OIE13_30595 [Streptosporangium sp. NBC_01810]|uniref:hypothetical protein n=1 Tax=Streptosporangium sp. NBC_01810 TaxID=2975951 RepID=UPI002DD85455|nr:hypothetical protein [Streptosporangium sp. NBC_01810]WSA25234.1 hypothetical protein OIE13_30595 [Streptosporangium sp. NBC_01810]